MPIEFSLEHLGLAAQDTTALKDWYVRSLGARVVFANGETPPAYIIEVPGGVWVEIYQGNYAVKEISDNKHDHPQSSPRARRVIRAPS